MNTGQVSTFEKWWIPVKEQLTEFLLENQIVKKTTFKPVLFFLSIFRWDVVHFDTWCHKNTLLIYFGIFPPFFQVASYFFYPTYMSHSFFKYKSENIKKNSRLPGV